MRWLFIRKKNLSWFRPLILKGSLAGRSQDLPLHLKSCQYMISSTDLLSREYNTALTPAFWNLGFLRVPLSWLPREVSAPGRHWDSDWVFRCFFAFSAVVFQLEIPWHQKQGLHNSVLSTRSCTEKHLIQVFFFFVFLPFFGPLPQHMGGSQARGLIGAVAASLRQSHSNAGSKPRLRPTPQLKATPDR